MMAASVVIEGLVSNSETSAIVMSALYLIYEVRLGVISDVRENQRVLGLAVYQLIERKTEMDAEAFRDSLWGQDKMTMPSDFEKGK